MSVSPPRPKGPPLNSLRAFEAAARLGGFALAAEELSVTPGAIAQHIKTVEAWTGVPLFDRKAQGVTLTPLGKRILPGFSAAFDTFGLAMLTLRNQSSPDHIHIAALPSIAQLWLSPRLPEIRRKFPTVTLSMTAMETAPNLKREPYDISLFFEEGRQARTTIILEPDVIFPVCSPKYADRLKHPIDLETVTCLHDATWSNDWNDWMAEADPDQHPNLQGPVFSLYALALEEVVNGGGVMIGHSSLVRSLLESGKLIVPFERRLSTDKKLVLRRAKPLSQNPVLNNVIQALREL